MTADRDDLAAILAKHYRLVRRANIARQECICGEWSMTNRSETFAEEAHRAHVASVVLESDWLRGVRAKELRDAADVIEHDTNLTVIAEGLRMQAHQILADNTTDRT